MNIAFITPSVSRTIGGIFEIERRLGQTLANIPGTKVSVHALKDEHTLADLALWQPLVPKVYPMAGPRAFGYSAKLNAAFMREDADVAHLHSLWMFTSVVVHRWGRTKKRPYLVTPNGMLEPWALRNSAWKKRIAGILYERSMLAGAACIQANTEKEAADIRAFGLNNPIAVIPNGVDLASFANPPSREVLESRFPALKDRRWMLFLSRIHPKKGLPHLLRAWEAVQRTEGGGQRPGVWILVIAGPDELSHEVEMKRLANELGLERSILFTGPLQGDEKLAALGGAEFFVLPSFSEGFSMAVLEAAAAGLPVMLTPQCNFPELLSVGGAVEVSPDADSCAAGLQKLLNLSDAERKQMGDNARKLVEASYNWSKVADQMLAVYRWLLGTGPKPECVVES